MSSTVLVFVFTLSLYLVSAQWTEEEINQFRGQVTASLFDKVYSGTLKDQPIAFVCGDTRNGEEGLFAALYLKKVHKFTGIEVIYADHYYDTLPDAVRETFQTEPTPVTDIDEKLRTRLKTGEIKLVADFFHVEEFADFFAEVKASVEALGITNAIEIVSIQPTNESVWENQKEEEAESKEYSETLKVKILFLSIENTEKCKRENNVVQTKYYFHIISKFFNHYNPAAVSLFYYQHDKLLPNFMPHYTTTCFTVTEVGSGFKKTYSWTTNGGWTVSYIDKL